MMMLPSLACVCIGVSLLGAGSYLLELRRLRRINELRAPYAVFGALVSLTIIVVNSMIAARVLGGM